MYPGMFIIDEFEYCDLQGKLLEDQVRPPQVGHKLLHGTSCSPIRDVYFRLEEEVSVTTQLVLSGGRVKSLTVPKFRYIRSHRC
jgi:hypothetical protein